MTYPCSFCGVEPGVHQYEHICYCDECADREIGIRGYDMGRNFGKHPRQVYQPPPRRVSKWTWAGDGVAALLVILLFAVLFGLIAAIVS